MMMNRIYLKLIFTAVVALMLWSCDSRDAARGNMDAADVALNASDYAAARTYCDEAYKVLSDTTRGLNVTTADLCRLALQYMTISDHSDTDENVGAATRCLRMALSINPDSTLGYLSAVPEEHDGHAALLISLQQTLDSPLPIDDEEPDSLPKTTDLSLVDQSATEHYGERR